MNVCREICSLRSELYLLLKAFLTHSLLH